MRRILWLTIKTMRPTPRLGVSTIATLGAIIGAVAVGYGLGNPRNLVSDSFGRALQVEQTQQRATWQTPDITPVDYHADQRAAATIRPALHTDTPPIAKLISIGDAITIADGIVFTSSMTSPAQPQGSADELSWEVIKLEVLTPKVTRLDRSLRQTQFVKVTARDANDAAAAPISFVLTLEMPLASFGRTDAGESL